MTLHRKVVYFAMQSLMRPPVFRPPLLFTMWLAIPTIIALGEAFLGPFWTLFLALPLSAVWVLIAGLSTVWFVQLVRQRAWQRSILALIPPAAMLLDPQALISVPMHVGDVIHFVREKPSYDRQVAALARNGSRFGEFNWGGMLFGSSGVVFDETDEMSLPKARRSAAWQARMKDTDLMCGGTDVGGISPLWAHYYLAGFGC